MTDIENEQDELMGLLMAIAHEDRRAFQRLYQKISGRMFGLCLKLASRRDLAEEAVQDAFVQIWHNAGEYHNERGAPLSWMLTIARYRTLDLMRSSKSRPSSGDAHLERVADQREGPLDESLRNAGNAELRGCLNELSETQRDSILLSYYRGFTHDELSEALSSPIGTVKSWIRRGLMALKRCLER